MSETDGTQHETGLNESGTTAPSMDGFKARTKGNAFVGSTVPVDVLSRIGLLFAVLCLVKMIMLIVLRKHLFESYWRVGSARLDWVNYAAFHVFALLGGMTLWKLGKRYESMGARMVRTINVFVLVLCAMFVALSFHEGNRNHLYPVMNGILGWKDLLPYLSLNFFFRSPYLAAWLGGYVMVYYWLIRTGRERLVLRVTAICATAYVMCCLRDLVIYREELIVVDVLGAACLLFWGRDNARWNLLWALLPVAFIGLVYLTFSNFSALLYPPRPECVVLVGGCVVVFAGSSLLAWRRGFHAGWLWLLTFAGVCFLLFLNANYPMSDNYRNLMCIGLTLPRYFLGEFGVALAMLAAAMAYRLWRPAGSIFWLDLFNVALIGTALIDLCLAKIVGTRLDWDLLSLALGEGPKMIWRMAVPYLPLTASMLLGIVAAYAVVLWCIGRLCRRQSSSLVFNRVNFQYTIVVLALLGFTGRWTLGSDKAIGQTLEVLAQSSPLWRNASTPRLSDARFREEALRLGMVEMVDRAAPSVVPKEMRDLNVVFVLLESTYNKHLSLFGCEKETQPLLSQYKDRMELFPNFYSSFAGSINARFACFTALYPLRDHKKFTLERVDVKSLFEILHEHGYSNSIFYSSYFDYTNFRDFLRGRQVGQMFDTDNMPGAKNAKQVSWGLSEDVTLAVMQQQIRQYAAARQKFFLTYIPAAPHYPYDGTLEQFCKFRREKYNDFTPLYMNELLFMDWVLASIVDELKKVGLLDNTLVVITGDHGEMLGADGNPVGHGWALTPELANVPLIIMDPGKQGFTINETVGSQVDLLPTILDKLGIPTPGDQCYQGISLYCQNSRPDRVIYLNTFAQYAILQGRRLVFGDRSVQSGNMMSARSFSITNEGVRTLCVEESPTAPAFSISVFDAFQENFLKNYSHYRQINCSEATALSSSSR